MAATETRGEETPGIGTVGPMREGAAGSKRVGGGGIQRDPRTQTGAVSDDPGATPGRVR